MFLVLVYLRLSWVHMSKSSLNTHHEASEKPVPFIKHNTRADKIHVSIPRA